MKTILLEKDVLLNVINSITVLDENGNVVLTQDINPETGKPFASEDEVVSFYTSLFGDEPYEFKLKNATAVKTKVSIYFVSADYTMTDYTDIQNYVITNISRNTPVKVIVDIWIDETNGLRAPITEKYLVPWFNYYDGNCDGVVILDVVNGHGEKIIVPQFSGVYDIDIEKVKKVKTNNELVPLQDIPEKLTGITRIIVEES